MTLDIDTVFRDSKIKGDPHSGANDPDKAEVRSLLKQIRDGSGQAVTRNTLSALNGVTPPNENYMGIVLTGPEAGYYSRSGGEWVFGRPFPDTFAEVALSGSGTAQTGAVNTGVNPASIEVFFASVTTPNTGPLTLSIGGEAARQVVNLAGNPLSAGEWTGMVMFYLNDANQYQLLIDAGAAASAAASAAAADAYRIAAAASASSAAASAAAAGAASGRFEIGAFAELATKFVYSDPEPGQEVLVEGDVILWREKGFAYIGAAPGATDAHFDYTGTGGVKIRALPTDNGSTNPLSLGAIPGVDATPIFEMARDIVGTRGTIEAADEYTLGDLQLTEQNLIGKKFRLAAGKTSILKLGNSTLGWNYRTVEGHFRGDDDASDLDNAGTAIAFTDAAYPEYAGRWNIEDSSGWYFDKFIHLTAGNIGNFVNRTSVLHCNYGIYAEPNIGSGNGGVGDMMQPGVLGVTGGEWAACYKAAVYIDGGGDPFGIPNGQNVFTESVIETNFGFGAYIHDYSQAWVPLTFNEVWWEANGSDPTPITMPDGQTHVPVDLHLDKVDHAVLRGNPIWKKRFIDSAVLLDGCFLSFVSEVENTNSVVRAINAHTDSFRGQPVLVESYINAKRSAGGLADTVLMPPRINKVWSAAGSVASFSARHDDPAGGTFGSSVGTLSWTAEDHGILFEKGAQFTLPASATVQIGALDVPTDTVVVYSLDIVHVSGPKPSLVFTGTGTLCGDLSPLITETGKWFTVGGIARAPSGLGGQGLWITSPGGGDSVLRIGTLQIVCFSDMAGAVSFYNDKCFLEP